MAEWRIFLNAEPRNGSSPPLPAGWYGGKVTTTNQPIYMRTPHEKDAVIFTERAAVIDTVRDWRRKGYSCYCVPSIVENYGHNTSNATSPADRIRVALDTPDCERLRDFYAVGPVQRAAVESFADAIGGALPASLVISKAGRCAP